MEDLSLHILDIVENAITANASKIDIYIDEDKEKDLQAIEISDNGSGMDEDAIKKVLDPFFTTKRHKRIGLGIPLFAQAARESEGEMKIESAVNKGTRIKTTFKLSHIDRKPLGDMNETMRVLKASHPEVAFTYEYVIRP